MIVYKNITLHRGDKEAIRIDYPGDISHHNLTFVLKKDRELTSQRLLQISRDNAVDSEKFSALYDGIKKITQLTIIPGSDDTQDLSGNFVFDIYDSTDVVTRFDGNIYIEADVQTPFDGTNLPSDGKRYLPYYPGNFNDKEILQYDSGTNEFKGKAPGSLSDENFYSKSEINESLSTKVDKVPGKVLSTNDFTDGLKTNYNGHLMDKGNPHETTKAQLGLDNVPNLDTTNAINSLGGNNILLQTLIEWTESASFQLLSITRDLNGVISTSTVKWPDGSSGIFIASTINSIWLAIDAYTISHNLSGKTIIQANVIRDSYGNIITKPVLTIL